MTLWYQQPAQEWTEALPVGNGRLGAMVYGGLNKERIQFNEDTLWNGEPGNNNRPGAAASLPDIRQLLFEERQQEAEGLASRTFMGDPLVLDAYQTFGTLLIDCPNSGQLDDYRRELDLNFGLVTVTYRTQDIQYTRQTFCSYPDQVLVWHIQANQPQQINLGISLECPHPKPLIETVSPNQINLSGQVRLGVLTFAAQLQVQAEGGQISTTNNRIRVRNADAVTLRLTGYSSFKTFKDTSADPMRRCTQTMERASQSTNVLLAGGGLQPFRMPRAPVLLD